MKSKKKFVFIGILLLSICFLGGCDDTSNYSLITCTKNASFADDDVTADLKYEIYYEGDYVKKTISTEMITSEDQNILKEYQTSYQNVFSKYQDIQYYDNTVTLKDHTVTSKTVIDYTKVNTDKIVEIEGDKGNIFTDKGKVKLETLLDLYKEYGAQCNN